MGDFDNSEIRSSIFPGDALYLMTDDFSLQLIKEGYNFQGQEQNITNFDDLESKLIEPLEELLKITSGSKETHHGFVQVPACLILNILPRSNHI